MAGEDERTAPVRGEEAASRYRAAQVGRGARRHTDRRSRGNGDIILIVRLAEGEIADLLCGVQSARRACEADIRGAAAQDARQIDATVSGAEGVARVLFGDRRQCLGCCIVDEREFFGLASFKTTGLVDWYPLMVPSVE